MPPAGPHKAFQTGATHQLNSEGTGNVPPPFSNGEWCQPRIRRRRRGPALGPVSRRQTAAVGAGPASLHADSAAEYSSAQTGATRQLKSRLPTGATRQSNTGGRDESGPPVSRPLESLNRCHPSFQPGRRVGIGTTRQSKPDMQTGATRQVSACQTVPPTPKPGPPVS